MVFVGNLEPFGELGKVRPPRNEPIALRQLENAVSVVMVLFAVLTDVILAPSEAADSTV